MTQSVQLRASLVWRDEVMGDVVLTRPRALTVGTAPGCTFLVPDVGLPPKFKIIKPGNRGYLLTLGHRMRGTIAVDGGKRDVSEFVRRGGEGEPAIAPKDGSSFRATPIGGRDWGVIELDATGDYKLFFQFVPVEAPLPRLSFGRYREVAAIGALILAAALAFPSYATVIVLCAMLGTAVFEIVLGFLYSTDDDFTRPAIAFSILVFGLLLGGLYIWGNLGNNENPFVPPGPRELTAAYLIERLQEEPPPPPPPPPPPQPPTDGAKKEQKKAEAAPKEPTKKPSNAASQNKAGKSGGEGEERMERKDAPEERKVESRVTEDIDRGRNTNDDKIADVMAMLAAKGPEDRGKDPGQGHGRGGGAGDELDGTGTRGDSRGNGTGGDGQSRGTHKTTGNAPKDRDPPGGGTGGTGSAPKEAKVSVKGGSGDFGHGLTRAQVDKVVRAAGGMLKRCYQKELDKDKSLGGVITVHFTIDSSGRVTSKNATKDTVNSAKVKDCVLRNIGKLSFPKSDGGANVTYPFGFDA